MECEITKCNATEYENPLEPVVDTSNDFIQTYDSLNDITDPKPYTIYSVNGTSYYYQSGEFINICEGGGSQEDIEELVNEINELVG